MFYIVKQQYYYSPLKRITMIKKYIHIILKLRIQSQLLDVLRIRTPGLYCWHWPLDWSWRWTRYKFGFFRHSFVSDSKLCFFFIWFDFALFLIDEDRFALTVRYVFSRCFNNLCAEIQLKTNLIFEIFVAD